MGILDSITGGSKDDKGAGISEALEAEEQKRNEEQIASLKEELETINEELGKALQKANELGETIALETPKLAIPEEAPGAAMEIAEAKRQLTRASNDIYDLKEKRKKILQSLKNLGSGEEGGGFSAGFGKLSAGAGKLHSFVSGWLPVIIVFAVTIVFGGVLGFFFPLFLVAGLGIGIFMAVYKKRPTLARSIAAFAILAFIISFVVFSPIAKQYGVDLQSLSLKGQQSSKATAGAQASALEYFGCISGTGSCQQAFDNYHSEQAQADYVESVTDTGAKLSEVFAARDFYDYSGLEAQGIVNAKGFLARNLIVEINASSAGLPKDLRDALNGFNDAWDCDGSLNENTNDADDTDGDNGVLKLEGARISNKFFTCSHEKINAITPLQQGDIMNVPVEVFASSRGTVSVASKQFVLARQEIYSASKGELSYFENFESTDFESKRIGDNSVDLAIRSPSGKDVISTGAVNFIEVKFENPTFATGKARVNKNNTDGAYKVYIYVPKFLAQYVDAGSDFTCNTSLVHASEIGLAGVIVGEGQAAECVTRRGPDWELEPNGYFRWSLKLKPLPSSLVFGDKTTFNVVAYADFDYTNSEVLSLEVKGTAPVPQEAAEEQPAETEQGGALSVP